MVVFCVQGVTIGSGTVAHLDMVLLGDLLGELRTTWGGSVSRSHSNDWKAEIEVLLVQEIQIPPVENVNLHEKGEGHALFEDPCECELIGSCSKMLRVSQVEKARKGVVIRDISLSSI